MLVPAIVGATLSAAIGIAALWSRARVAGLGTVAIGAVACGVWCLASLSEKQPDGPGPYWQGALWVASVSVGCAAALVIARRLYVPRWAPGRRLRMIFVAEPVLIAAQALTQPPLVSGHRAADGTWEFGVAFALHATYCATLLVLSAAHLILRLEQARGRERVYVSGILLLICVGIGAQIGRIEVMSYAAVAALLLAYLAIADARAYERRVSAATRISDHVTGLLSRAAIDFELELAIEDAKQTGRPLALLLLDADSFKQVNDTYGHLVGDAVLRDFAACVLAAVGDRGSVGRFGGDEIVVVLPDTTQVEACGIARRIVKELREHRRAKAQRLAASVGVAVYQGGGARSLLADADTAMYAAKRAGGDRWSLPTNR